jgi:hypothetical protein
MRLRCVLAGVALAVCLRGTVATTPVHSARLQPELGAAGLEDVAGVAQALEDLGLSQLQDVQRLDAEEASEMKGALRRSAVSLGDRSRLRRMLAGPAEFHGSISNAPSIASVLAEAESSRDHRAMQAESEGSSSGGGVSGDSLAIIATVLVALVGYAVCAGESPPGLVAVSGAITRSISPC